MLVSMSIDAFVPAAPSLGTKEVLSRRKASIDDGLIISEAKSVSQALAELWECVASSPKEDVAVVFGECDALRSDKAWSAFFEHLECCKDVCDEFGSSTVAVPSVDGTDHRALVIRRVQGGDYREEEEDDDDDDWDLSPELAAKLAALSDDDDASPSSTWSAFVDDGADDDAIVSLSKRWVDAIVSGAGVCPFSVNAEKAGLPVGKVRYAACRAKTTEEVYASYWSEVDKIQCVDQKALSTTLMILTEKRWTENLEEFETLGTTLAQALETTDGLGFENDLQLVFFHPLHVFRDGRERTGADSAANFARRSPYPMINILRTSQVREAQKGLPTALVYAQNEATLDEIGSGLLDSMLKQRDWSPVDGKKVDRKAVEVLRLAQDLMKQAEQQQ